MACGMGHTTGAALVGLGTWIVMIIAWFGCGMQVSKTM